MALILVTGGCGFLGATFARRAREAGHEVVTADILAGADSHLDAADPAAIALRGDWQIPAEDYVLHLIEDGTFVEDFQGVLDFRTGKYSVDGDTISLVGDDGNTDTGTVVGDTLEFTLGTATRLE